ncbi:MAG: glycosyltransferase family 2 protein [Clostridiales bacterium]|nr:glycosyltransferase family 2 protein [Clostridiales bacterium]
MKIAVLTPTYNRAHLLGRLYHSLLSQTDTDFVWIVVDDGSTDDTESVIESFVNARPPFTIRYYYKENGGKASALNYAFQNEPDIDFFAVIDSDDHAVPEALHRIREKVGQYEGIYEVGAIFFRYQNPDGSILHLKGGLMPAGEVVMTRYEHDACYAKDDGCMGYFQRAVSEYRYPVYKNEKYVGPIVIQMMMADKYKIAFTNVVIGIAEYQEGGLSKSGRKLRLNNPMGMVHYSGLLQSKQNPSRRIRLKYAISAQAYACFGHLSKQDIAAVGMDKRYLKKWAKPFGWLLAGYWRKNSI